MDNKKRKKIEKEMNRVQISANAEKKEIEYIEEIDPTFNRKKHTHIIKAINIASETQKDCEEKIKEIENKLIACGFNYMLSEKENNKLQKKNTELKEERKEIRKLLELHFKCDCLACVTNVNVDNPCKNTDKCEAYKTYKKIMDKLK
jgi:hypothetical protein